MLRLSDSLIGKPVMSLRTGQVVATTTAPIINPNNLKIEGFYCEDRFERKKELVLLYQDIRDVINQGFIINDHDVLIEPSELVRLQKIMEIDFTLIDKPVITLTKQKLGKVSDYSTEVETMYIQKIYVTQSMLKNLTGGNLGIERSQINEITNKKIIVNDPLERGTVHAGAPA